MGGSRELTLLIQNSLEVTAGMSSLAEDEILSNMKNTFSWFFFRTNQNEWNQAVVTKTKNASGQ